MTKPRTRRKAAQSIRLVMPSGPIEFSWPPPNVSLGELQRTAIEWTHVLRNRARWVRSPSGQHELDSRARELLEKLGIGDDEQRKLAQSRTVRVCMPFHSEDAGWEARILPWEFILTAATRDRRSDSLVVTRGLVTGRATVARDVRNVLFVESVPGHLAQDWDFKEECRLVKTYTRAKRFERLLSPTVAQLAEAIKKQRPGIVHLAGFDTHQGLELLNDEQGGKAPDGYLLAGPKGVALTSAAELAQAIASSGSAPTVMFCSFWNSGARVAPLAVAAGVTSALGFQDGVDDAIAEIFLASFYRAFSESGDVEAGFAGGWSSLQSQPKPIGGTGVVLWRGGTEASLGARATQSEMGRRRSVEILLPDEVTSAKAQELITVSVQNHRQLSYGLLHNDRDLFEKFLIRNLSESSIRGLEVFVELHSNEGTYPYRRSFSIDEPVLDLSRLVRIALTSTLSRTLDEVLRTSLYVEVRWGEHKIYSETFPVTLAPVDQWNDTDMDRAFLPSFVFPRDLAVSSVIRNAEHFMTVLRDDPAAGFDGYQAVDPERANPAEDVDRQVQALWYSVLYRVPASYINPPPTYTAASQRIRTPSEIVEGGFGTCIDLALMVASCLEAVEIYPVLFLLNDHAFPGYWRTDAALEAFLRRVSRLSTTADGRDDAISGDGSAARRAPGAAWCFDRSVLKEIKRAIEHRQLIPLESVGLTGRWSLSEAAEGGRGYFDEDNEARFLLMLDVTTARQRGVTPLPLGPRPR